MFEVYHRNLKRWSRDNDEATLHGTVEDRAASGFDHHLEFVGHSTYVLPAGMVAGKRYTAPFEELVVADAANPVDGNGKAYSHAVNTSPAVVEYAQQVRFDPFECCVHDVACSALCRNASCGSLFLMRSGPGLLRTYVRAFVV